MATTQLPIEGVFDRDSGEFIGIAAESGGEILVESASSGYTQLSAAYTIGDGDAKKRFACSTSLTVTINSSSADTIIFPPASGSLTITGSGVTLNGDVASIIRTLSSNRAGVAIVKNPVIANDYSVTGV